MSFQIKDFASIVAAEINHARAVTQKITDFAPGSVARTIMEAPAVEIEELYMQFFLGLRDAIPVATFKSFNFNIIPAALARGYVTVSRSTPLSSDLLIPSGTQFTTSDGKIYVSSADITLAAGQTSVRIAIQAYAVGAAYNVASGLINSSTFFDTSFIISNSAITSGRDLESDAAREARFAEFIQSLSRGTIAACEYAIKQVAILDSNGNVSEYVDRIGTDETPGYVKHYVYSSAGIPSDALLAEAQKVIDGWKDPATGVITPGFRAAGVRNDAMRMTERAIDETFSVGMLPGYALTDAVRQSLASVYDSLILGVRPGDVLYIGTIVDLMLGVTGVLTVVPSATQNIVCGANEALVPGTLTINQL